MRCAWARRPRCVAGAVLIAAGVAFIPGCRQHGAKPEQAAGKVAAEWERLGDDLADAVAGSPDRGRARAAAERLAATPIGAAKLESIGDDEDLVSLRGVLTSKNEGKLQGQEEVFSAAVRIADLAVATDLARGAPPTEFGDFELRRGAWLCLIGERAAGLSSLAAAAGLGRRMIPAFESQPAAPPDVHANARVYLAELACGKERSDVWSDPAFVPSPAPLAALGLATVPASLLDSLVRASRIDSRVSRLAVLSLVSGRIATATDLKEVVEWVAPCGPVRRDLDDELRMTFATPVTVLGGDVRDSWPGPADALERAAAKLLAFAAHPGDVAPCPAGPGKRDPQKREHVSETVRAVAYHSWLWAAAAHARSGDAGKALADATKAESIADPRDVPLTVPVRVAVGDGAGARAVLDRHVNRADAEPRDRLMLATWRAFALTLAGTLDEARDAAIAANNLARDVAVDAGPHNHIPGIEDQENATMWLRASLVFRTKKGDPFLPIDAYDSLHPFPASKVRSNATSSLFTTASSPSTAGPFRASLCLTGTAGREWDIAPLPWAFAYLVGETVPRGDVETWLDCAARDRGAPRHLYFYSRAAAARLRGDAAAAASWEARSARLAALVHDDATAVLAALAGY
jgi:hypothetical protein